ncbi:hypothetical protein [uncultured Pseudacidovorax sp.]|uniref:preprotein translocase subunit SecA n=1 Tax=uncultured Pseudacidovorax sp. TaxID=679313 RepID=UPI0025ECD4A4|nr:hypothetical protein [uncultured Pseudacidovorax sp.]
MPAAATLPTDLARLLPRPGPVWGARPMRPGGAEAEAPPARRLSVARLLRTPAGFAARIGRDAQAHAQRWQALPDGDRPAALAALRRRLRREGLQPAALAEALGVASGCASLTLGLMPRQTQRMAAAALLDGRFAEMATGEGKTLALALAAAVGALAGMPVHVVTANDYLAGRDATWLAPFYDALGLRACALRAADVPATRPGLYAHDVVHTTARELAFDFLRDRFAQAADGVSAVMPAYEHGATVAADAAAPSPGRLAPAPHHSGQRGLCLALIDEADSILMDEADLPLVLSRPVLQAARRAFLWQAFAVARQLQPGRDFDTRPAEREAELTPAGEARLAALSASLPGRWRWPRYRREAVCLALVAQHLLQRDAHYLVRDGAIVLLDEVSGRAAEGRVLARGLQTLVALKEGLRTVVDSDVVAQTSFARFFLRYWRLAGLSGTLWQARHELRQVFGARVVRVPLHAPSRLRRLPPRVFASAEARWQAVAATVAALQAAGHPVLVGTDDVADSQALSAVLRQAGIAHRVLNALQDAQEAEIVAGAGRAGQVTVATRMAGRGTDIALDAAARAAGGLHVLCCQHNPSQRLDRQLVGRAARHGEPGSAQLFMVQPEFSLVGLDSLDELINNLVTSLNGIRESTTWLQRLAWQWHEEGRRARLRAALLAQERQWERHFPSV